MPQPAGLSTKDPTPKDPRVYMAAERTFLAWIRTGLALMAFGFVLARFGIFLRSLSATTAIPDVRQAHFSVSVGIGLIGVGVLVQVLSVIHYRRLIQDLNTGMAEFDQPSTLASAVSVIMAAIGLAMAVYLSIVR
jgi:putative membrane protein